MFPGLHRFSKKAHVGGARVLTRGREPQAGDTPLVYACWKGHLPVVQFLVEKGADKNFKNHVRPRGPSQLFSREHNL
jgi:hypothetical protein